MINPAYQDSWQQAKDVLDKQGFVLLAQLLTQEAYTQLHEEIKKRTYTQEHQPALYNYAKALVPEQAHKLLEEVTKQLELPTPTTTQLRRYAAGSYSLQDADEAPAGYEYCFFFADEWNPDWRGEHTYAHPDKEPLRVPPQENALLIIKRDEQTKAFIKRVTHHANNQSYHALHANSR